MPKNGKMTEQELQSSLSRAAVEYGWLDHRVWNSLHSPKGWPDLTFGAVARNWLVVWECKNEKGKATPEQVRWLNWWKGFADHVMEMAHFGETHGAVFQDVRISIALVRPADLESCYQFLIGTADQSKWPTPWSVQ